MVSDHGCRTQTVIVDASNKYERHVIQNTLKISPKNLS